MIYFADKSQQVEPFVLNTENLARSQGFIPPSLVGGHAFSCFQERCFYHEVSTRPLFGPSGKDNYLDIHQGTLGSCALLTAALSVSHRYPGYISHCFRPCNDTFIVYQPYQQNQLNLKEPQLVVRSLLRFKSSFCRSNAVGANSHPGSIKPIWPSMLEKAFVQDQCNGIYDNLDRGLDPAQAFMWLIGCPAQTYLISRFSPSQWLHELNRQFENGECIVFHSKYHAWALIAIEKSITVKSLCYRVLSAQSLFPQRIGRQRTKIWHSNAICKYAVAISTTIGAANIAK